MGVPGRDRRHKCRPRERQSLPGGVPKPRRYRGSDMSDVVHRACKGQGSDPSAACELLAQFVKAANALSEGWDPVLDRGYPRYLPSFDEFIEALIGWREVVEEKQAVDEDEEIEP